MIDLVTSTIKERFEQKGFQMLQKLERVLTIKEPQQVDIIKDVVSFYGADLNNADCLQTQLNALHTAAGSETTLTDVESVVTYLKSLNSVEKQYYSEVIKVVILVMPATNAVSERSFSALHRLKTWLRTTVQQVRLHELVYDTACPQEQN